MHKRDNLILEPLFFHCILIQEALSFKFVGRFFFESKKRGINYAE